MTEESTPTAGFLAAEEAAERLASSLQRLNAETENYAAAGKTLDQVGTDVRELAAQTSEVATRTAEAVDAIRSIGSVQILEHVQALTVSSDATASEVEAMGPKLEALVEQLAVVREAQTELAGKADRISTQQQSLVAELAAMVHTEVEPSLKAATGAKYAAGAAAVLAAVAAVLTRI